MNKFKLFILLLTILTFIVSCDEEENDKIKLLITCEGPFEGYYIYNSNDPVGFGGGTTGDNPYIISGSLYYYSKTFKDLESIYVEASRDNLTDILKIGIYREDTEVGMKSIDNSSSAYTVDLTYDYDDNLIE